MYFVASNIGWCTIDLTCYEVAAAAAATAPAAESSSSIIRILCTSREFLRRGEALPRPPPMRHTSRLSAASGPVQFPSRSWMLSRRDCSAWDGGGGVARELPRMLGYHTKPGDQQFAMYHRESIIHVLRYPRWASPSRCHSLWIVVHVQRRRLCQFICGTWRAA